MGRGSAWYLPMRALLATVWTWILRGMGMIMAIRRDLDGFGRIRGHGIRRGFEYFVSLMSHRERGPMA